MPHEGIEQHALEDSEGGRTHKSHLVGQSKCVSLGFEDIGSNLDLLFQLSFSQVANHVMF